ncbi:hypothetical protein [Vulcanisaeta distributa]|uniref:hypothetical protein n=1 Tax=Vulcanisaeta distributa TaxID=164451 RepID=UPI0006D14AD2|nr:hypothetical protein [Vulcanisaeta distributa]
MNSRPRPCTKSLEVYEHRLHVIARNHSGSRPSNADLVAMGNMPFMMGSEEDVGTASLMWSPGLI